MKQSLITKSKLEEDKSIISNQDNTFLFQKFEIINIEKLSPNDFFLKFKELYLNSNEQNFSIKIEEVKNTIDNQDFYDAHLFFIKYFKVKFEKDWEEIQIFSKELLEKSKNLKSFLDNISGIIYDNLRQVLEEKTEQWFAWLTFTTENILISESENKPWKFLFWLSDEKIWKKLLYWSIRHLILERWITFPTIKKDGSTWMLFQEFSLNELDLVFQRLSNFNNNTKNEVDELKIIKNFPSAKDFIIYCIKNFAWLKKTDKWIDEFIISNHIWAYIGDNINSFTFEDFREILLEAVEIRQHFFHYMLSTEWDIIRDLIAWTIDLEKKEIEKIDIDWLKKIYIKNYLKKQLERWREFHINTIENKFYLSIESFQKIVKDSSKLKITTPQNQVKAFLWWEKNLITKMANLLENNLNKSNEFLKEWNILISSKSDEENIDKLVELIHRQYLKNSNEIDLKNVEKKDCINEELLNETVEDYKKQFETLLKNWTKKYGELLFWYDKHFLPIWWKIHFKDSLAEEKIEKLKQTFWFDSTPFQLQHANESMLLPPCESPFQLIEVLNKLSKLEIINDWDLELQLSIAWRLTNELSWILGSAMIFLKNYSIIYPKEAFVTSHNEDTWSCIVCYDAWVMLTEWFSNIWKEREWRTDILGNKKIEEVVVFSIISNLLSQAQFWWVHEKAWLEFIEEYKFLLEKYNIWNILEWKWVHNPSWEKAKDEDYSKHSELVNICTDILNEWINQSNKFWNKNTLIFELRDLVWKYIRENWLLPDNIKERKAIA